MDAKELKFLLKLLGCENYRAAIAQIKPNPGMKAAQRDSICRRLQERGFVGMREEVTKINIATAGRSLLADIEAIEELPIASYELQVLKASSKGTITPGKTKLPAASRQAVIQGLVGRGLIKAVEKKIEEVWLSDRGRQYLCLEYHSNSNAKEITLKMLSDYLQLLRQYRPSPSASPEKDIGSTSDSKPNDEEILNLIRELDEELGTDNYLPIYHMRQRLQPPLSRKELDLALYRLEASDKIELSSLQDVRAYTPEQVEAGIPQDIGGRLFFIIVN
jgi:predicted transcriptional regulator